MLKKQAIYVKTCEWVDVSTVTSEDQAEPVKFVKVSSNEHSVIALDEFGKMWL